jgi:hypothetical protein
MRHSPLLLLHISAGMIGMVSGTAAIIFRKGSARHVLAGRVFVVAMVSMAASVTYLAYLKDQPSGIGGGIPNVLSGGHGWVTAKRRDGGDQQIRLGCAFGSVGARNRHLDSGRANGAGGVKGGSSSSWNGLFHGFRVAARCDGGPPHVAARRLFRHTAHGAASLAHVPWLIHRLGVLLLGTREQDVPSVFEQSNLLFTPAFLPLVLLVFSAFRVRFAIAYKISGTKSAPQVRNAPSPGGLAVR